MTSDELIEVQFQEALSACRQATDSRGLFIKLVRSLDAHDLWEQITSMVWDMEHGIPWPDDVDGVAYANQAHNFALLTNLYWRLVRRNRMLERRETAVRAGD